MPSIAKRLIAPEMRALEFLHNTDERRADDAGGDRGASSKGAAGVREYLFHCVTIRVCFVTALLS